MSNILNVLANAYGPMVVQLDDINKAVSGALKAAAEVNAKNDAKRADAGWRQEYEELSRRFPMDSVDESEARLSKLEAAVASTVKEYKSKVSECREALKEQFLTPLEVSHIEQKLEVLSGELEDFKRQADAQVRFAEARLAEARQFAHLRPRWQELRDRAAKIDKALRQV